MLTVVKYLTFLLMHATCSPSLIPALKSFALFTKSILFQESTAELVDVGLLGLTGRTFWVTKVIFSVFSIKG